MEFLLAFYYRKYVFEHKQIEAFTILKSFYCFVVKFLFLFFKCEMLQQNVLKALNFHFKATFLPKMSIYSSLHALIAPLNQIINENNMN